MKSFLTKLAATGVSMFDMTLALTDKTFTLSIKPKPNISEDKSLTENITPIIASGALNDFDEDVLIEALKKPLTEYNKIVVEADQFAKSVKEAEKTAEHKKAEKEKTAKEKKETEEKLKKLEKKLEDLIKPENKPASNTDKISPLVDEILALDSKHAKALKAKEDFLKPPDLFSNLPQNKEEITTETEEEINLEDLPF